MSSTKDMSRTLMQYAGKNGSKDNISVLVIKFWVWVWFFKEYSVIIFEDIVACIMKRWDTAKELRVEL